MCIKAAAGSTSRGALGCSVLIDIRVVVVDLLHVLDARRAARHRFGPRLAPLLKSGGNLTGARACVGRGGMTMVPTTAPPSCLELFVYPVSAQLLKI
eukprot:7162983-Prymnesium_polylepis.1